MKKCVVFLLLAAPAVLGAAQKEIIRVGPNLNLPFSPAVRAGGFIYVAGTMATDDQGKLVAGDIKVQTRRSLENIAKVLTAAGSDITNAVSVTAYLKRISDFEAMNEVYRTFWPQAPPVRTTIGADLVLPEGLVEFSMVAVPRGGERKIIHPADWLKSPLPYSYGIMSGDTLFLAGLVSRSGRDNKPVEGDMKSQVKVTMENAGAILKSAGMNFADVVSSRVFITDTALFQDMNAAYRAYFPKDPPARATVRAALAGPQYLVEITMVAVKGGERAAVITPSADGTPGQANPNLSSAIRVGKRLYLSGMLGNTPDSKGDIRAQTRETLARLGRTLKAAGFGWEHVVDGIVYITDVGRFSGMNEAYREVFKSDFPARATTGTGLVNADGLVEIMLTAVKE